MVLLAATTVETTGDVTGAAKIAFWPQTAAAMVVAMVVYTMVYYVAVSLVLIAEDNFPGLFSTLLMGTRPNVLLALAAVFGAAASMPVARLACDLTLRPYGRRYVFWMFAGVLGAMALGKVWSPATGQQMAVVAQFATAVAMAWLLFWREEDMPEVAGEEDAG